MLDRQVQHLISANYHSLNRNRLILFNNFLGFDYLDFAIVTIIIKVDTFH